MKTVFTAGEFLAIIVKELTAKKRAAYKAAKDFDKQDLYYAAACEVGKVENCRYMLEYLKGWQAPEKGKRK